MGIVTNAFLLLDEEYNAGRDNIRGRTNQMSPNGGDSWQMEVDQICMKVSLSSRVGWPPLRIGEAVVKVGEEHCTHLSLSLFVERCRCGII
jgi:hypothetical protein